MADDQARCPQCGAAVSPSARFCVTCGIRLPDPATSRLHSGDTSTYGWKSRDDSAVLAQAPAEPTNDAISPDEPIDEPEDDPTETPTIDHAATVLPAAPDEEPIHASSGWENWTSSGTDVIAIPLDDDSSNLIDAVDFSADPPERSEADDTDIDSVSLLTEDPVEPETEASTLESTPPTAIEHQPDEESSESVAPAVTPDDPSAGDSPDDGEMEEADGNALIAAMSNDETDAGEDEESADDFEPAGWSEIEEQLAERDPGHADHAFSIMAVDDSAESAPGEAEEKTDSSESLDRAYALLHELQILLPGLATSASSESDPVDVASAEPAFDFGDLREIALAARGESSFDDFASLRTVVDEAVSRPRDIEVVLQLSQRIEDIHALLGERDRLQRAFDELIARLTHQIESQEGQ